MDETSIEDRDKILNIRTNGMLEEINKYLVDESTEQYSPVYTSILKKPSVTTIEKWQKQVDALVKFFQDDKEIGYIIYKIYLCQALVYYLSGDDNKARAFFDEATDYERFDVVLYYLAIVKRVGGRVPKAGNYDKRPHNSYELETALKNDKGRIPWYRHITVGLPYAVSSHFSEWTEEEKNRYVFLRAIEWLALPGFVAMGVGAPLLLVVKAVYLIVAVAVINFIWSLFATRFVSLGTSEMVVYINKLKWLTAPFTAVVFLLKHDYAMVALALLWPIVSILLSLVRINDKKGVIAHKLKQQIFLKTR